MFKYYYLMLSPKEVSRSYPKRGLMSFPSCYDITSTSGSQAAHQNPDAVTLQR